RVELEGRQLLVGALGAGRVTRNRAGGGARGVGELERNLPRLAAAGRRVRRGLLNDRGLAQAECGGDKCHADQRHGSGVGAQTRQEPYSTMDWYVIDHGLVTTA